MKETISSRNVNHDGIRVAGVFKEAVGMRSALRGAALSSAAIALPFALLGWPLAGAQAPARWSARVSLVLFALAFAGPAWNALVPTRGAGTIAGQEWPLSPAFPGSHLVHLAA